MKGVCFIRPHPRGGGRAASPPDAMTQAVVICLRAPNEWVFAGQARDTQGPSAAGATVRGAVTRQQSQRRPARSQVDTLPLHCCPANEEVMRPGPSGRPDPSSLPAGSRGCEETPGF